MTRSVTVIGAGIVGMCTASYLQRAGLKVAVLDPVEPGGSCSFGNAGGLSPGSCVPASMPGILKQVPKWLTDPTAPLVLRWRYAPRALPWLWRFVMASRPETVERSADAISALTAPVFENYAPLIAEAGAEGLIRRNGQIYVYESEAAFLKDARGWDIRRRRSAKFEVMSADDIRKAEPALAPIFQKGVRLPTHGYCVDPYGLVQALAAAFRKNGGEILPHRVLDIEMDGNQPRTLVTDAGRRPVETLIIAAGAWSGQLARKLGHKVPLETQRGYHAMVADPAKTPNATIMWAERKFLATPMAGGMRFAGTVEIAGLNAPPDYSRADQLLAFGREMFPGLGGGTVTRWMGHRPSLPDSVAVIGPSPRVSNVFFAFGHGHVGLSCASTTGRLVSELVVGSKPCVDPRPYRIDRF
ncbi:MAG: FAD-dependent oxidoreductase [Rhodospirillales bacterium]|nr:FAD-dependent oxidoreductase [Rhodospirillales bacterium]